MSGFIGVGKITYDGKAVQYNGNHVTIPTPGRLTLVSIAGHHWPLTLLASTLTVTAPV